VHLWQDLEISDQIVPKLKIYGTQNILFAFKCLHLPKFCSVTESHRKAKTIYFQQVTKLSEILPFLQLRWYWAKIAGKLCLNCCRDQLLRSRSERFRHPVSTTAGRRCMHRREGA
jgi:hypothetical protein